MYYLRDCVRSVLTAAPYYLNLGNSTLDRHLSVFQVDILHMFSFALARIELCKRARRLEVDSDMSLLELRWRLCSAI